MNKQKLIGLIIKKQTYKDTKPIQSDIQRKKQQAVTISISSILQILKQDYNAQAKLYSIRYLKDCFEKGNQSFITKTQNKLLPILVKIIKDSNQQQAVMKYGGSYTKNTDLQKFKSLVLSLFAMCRECVEKWAKWIPDQDRGFIKAQRQIAYCKNNPWENGFVYFREENQNIFKENCQKNGVKLSSAIISNPNSQKTITQAKPQSQLKPQQQNTIKTPQPLSKISQQQSKKQKSKSMAKIKNIIKTTEQKIQNNQQISENQLKQIQAKFNAAINQYIQQVQDFDEHYLESKIQQFEELKVSIIKSNKQKQKNTNNSQIQNNNQKQKQNQIQQNNSQNSQIIKKQQTNKNKQISEVQQALNKMQIQINQPNKIPIKSPSHSQSQSNSNNLTFKNIMTQNQSNKQITVIQKTEKQQQISKTSKISKVQNSNDNKIKQNNINNTNKSNKSKINDQQRVNFERSDSQDYQHSQYDENKKLLKINSNGFNSFNMKNNNMNDTNKNNVQVKNRDSNNRQSAKFGNNNDLSSNNINKNPQFIIVNPNSTQINKQPSFILKNSKQSQNNKISSQNNKLSQNQQINKSSSFSSAINSPSFKDPNIIPFTNNPTLQQPNNSQIHTNSNIIQSNINSNNSNNPSVSSSQILQLNKKYQLETSTLQNKIYKLEKQMNNLKQNQNNIKQKYKNSVSNKEVQNLKKQLYQQKNDKYLMSQQINQLKSELKRMKTQFQKSKQQYKINYNSLSLNNQQIKNQINFQNSPSGISKSRAKLTKIKPNLTLQNQQNYSQTHSRVKSNILPIQQPLINNISYATRIDDDYINNQTYYDKIGSWLSSQNIINYKKCILGLSELFYKNQQQGINIYRMQYLFNQNQADFLKLTFNYHFKRIQNKLPKIIYKNIPQIDFWTKPITGIQQKYTQQTIGRLCLTPLKIMKGIISYNQNYSKTITFLLPFLFYNYLHPIQFDIQQFQQIYNIKNYQIHKSKVINLNNYIACTAIDLSNIFKYSILNNQYLNICLSQQLQDRVYMIRIELLRNQKAVIKVLPIPYNPQMIIKAKDLIGNLVFLLS